MLLLLFIKCAYAETVHNHWKFTGITPFLGETQDRGANYRVELRNVDTTESGSQDVSRARLQPLTKYFNIGKIEELKGKDFKTDNDTSDPWQWLEELSVKIKNNGNYVSPSPEELYDRAARALAEMELPDFSDVETKDVLKIFSLAYVDNQGHANFNTPINENWLSDFKEKVSKYSSGKVVLLEASPSDKFSYYVLGKATYLKLENKETGRTRPLIMGPYGEPFQFADGNGSGPEFNPVVRSNIPK